MFTQIAAICFDAGPKNAFNAFKENLLVFGYNLTVLEKDATDEAIIAAIRQCASVFVGLSSSQANARIEILAAETALKHDKPVCCFAVSPVDLLRPWFNQVPVTACFGVLPQDLTEAQAFYPNASFFRTSSPDRDAFAVMAGKRQQLRTEARARLKVEDDTFLVGISLRRGPENFETILRSLEFMRRYNPQAHAVLLRHPHDPYSENAYHYDYYKKNGGIHFVDELDFTTAEIVPGLDIIVGSEADSSLTMAAYMLVPSGVTQSHVKEHAFAAVTGNAVPEMLGNNTAFWIPWQDESWHAQDFFSPAKVRFHAERLRAMEICYQASTEKHPSAKAVAAMLEAVLKKA